MSRGPDQRDGRTGLKIALAAHGRIQLQAWTPAARKLNSTEGSKRPMERHTVHTAQGRCHRQALPGHEATLCAKRPFELEIALWPEQLLEVFPGEKGSRFAHAYARIQGHQSVLNSLTMRSMSASLIRDFS